MRIRLENLSKSYQGKCILDNLNWQVNHVGVVGIIGESGCGKSTLLRQLAGIEMPDCGSVQINHWEVQEKNLAQYQETIGVVFQKHNLFPHLTVEENIMLLLTKIRGLDFEVAKKRCDLVLQQFHLEDQAAKLPSKISGGQAQRASIARALVTQPDLLFLDEPTAALDPLLTKEVLDSIRLLKLQGVEFVFVTHEMAFLKQFADYFLFMDKGRIVESDYIKNFTNPKTDKLRKFMESSN